MRRSRTVRVSEDVFARLQRRAKPLDDTVSSVMARVLDRLERLELEEKDGYEEALLHDLDITEAEKHMSSPFPEEKDGYEEALLHDLDITGAEKHMGFSPRIVLSSVNAGANEHYRNTVESPVSLEQIEEFITFEDWSELSTLYPAGEALIWGYATGPRNRKNFARVQVNDIVLMYQNGGYFSSFRVAKKLESELAAQLAPELSRMLWGIDRDGYTRDLICFLTDGRRHKKSISVGDVAKIAGQGPRTTVRGLWVLDRTPSTRVIEHFGLAR